jgi:phosphate transport system substrate-binding protein
MRRNIIGFTALFSAGLFSPSATADFHRGYIAIVGSSTVVPFAKAVGERLSKTKKFQTPLLQSTGTGGGIKLFCEGLGAESPDIVNTSRPMKPKEREECRKNGVGDVLELKIGYDGLVLAQSKKAPPLALTRKEVRLALTKWVADPSGKLVANPYKTWKDINPALPDTPIEIYGPPVASGTYDTLLDLISELECKGRPWTTDGKSEPAPDMLRKCRSIREDGAYIEGRENDEDHVPRLTDSPTKVAILNYKLLSEHADRLRAIPIDGVEPTYETIANKTYVGSRPLYLYIKTANIAGTPGLKEYIADFASEQTWGEKGYLKPIGLIAMSPDERATYTAEVKALGISPSTGTPTKAAAKSTKGSKGSSKSAARHESKAKSHK